ncbi:type II secretion system protein M [Idiomarina loihiensis]|uniref:type II secretion system protein M n=1 Tax=Idiomarina loihiensis TaxID=135577 RepID=UPI00129C6541|nr:type II secretion system protein M [Idiomarina loihiensis]MRJ44777.1 type II secretion system protein M [Idiomarina loihiensis]UTW33267.1 type II secretion system protein M [Idiomarina loihiensis]
MNRITGHLTPYLDLGKQRWQQFNQREQSLLAVLAGVLFIAFLYFVIWQPSSQAVANAERQLAAQQQQYQWVQQAIARYKKLEESSSEQQSASASVSQRINRAAAAQDIQIARLQPQGQEYLLSVDEVAFSDLLSFLAELEQRQGLSLKAVDIAKLNTPGQVRLRKLLVSEAS